MESRVTRASAALAPAKLNGASGWRPVVWQWRIRSTFGIAARIMGSSPIENTPGRRPFAPELDGVNHRNIIG
jgi:hypothetical protein